MMDPLRPDKPGKGLLDFLFQILASLENDPNGQGQTQNHSGE